MARPSSGKRNIEQSKRERAARKRERRERVGDEPDGTEPVVAAAADRPSESELLDALADLQARFDAEELTFEGYEEQKARLLAQLAGS